MGWQAIPQDFFNRHPVEVARDLIGTELMVAGVGGIVVETEAYAEDDPASHSFRGKTARNAAMFGAPATAYVYRSYGLHWCLNAVCRPGTAVLLRAMEPSAGLEVMAARRGVNAPRLLASGPGRLCQALAVDARHDGTPLLHPPFRLLSRPGTPIDIVSGHRIGISRATEKPWRFGLAGSPFLSRRFG
jgi:DNA-3-methyladenine glycosylase (3mg)